MNSIKRVEKIQEKQERKINCFKKLVVAEFELFYVKVKHLKILNSVDFSYEEVKTRFLTYLTQIRIDKILNGQNIIHSTVKNVTASLLYIIFTIDYDVEERHLNQKDFGNIFHLDKRQINYFITRNFKYITFLRKVFNIIKL